tara:strand:+ start:211 stop:693 length:483 start_codon:yes stop_codon:yes gene_type:complete
MTLDLDAKKILLRKIPHGLFICGVRDGDDINGFTASWVTQGSFTPPIVVICVKSDGSSHQIIKKTNKFSLNVLKKDQKDIAATFFKPQKGLGGRFETLSYTFGPSGLPLLEDCIGGVECELIGNIENGDHTIFAGEVKYANLISDSDSLLLSSTGWNYGG